MTVAKGAQSAYDAYAQLVILGQLPTNDLHSVSMKYNLLQQSLTLALIESRGNTNAVASPSLDTAYADFLNTVNAAKATK